MESKNNSILIGVVAVILGLSLGYMMWGGQSKNIILTNVPNGTHMMPDGSMMANGGSMDMTSMMIAMNAELRGKTGDAFDRAFLREMIVHHEGAVEMAKLALTNAKHQEIIDLSKAIITAQNKEIGDMRSWLNSWY
jgi:uncharacterized protein (DUF305 family)